MHFAVLGSVLLMGFLGSMHCGVMCGPLSCNFKNTKQFVSYHLGRLVSYSIIGFVLFTGSQFLLDNDSRQFKMVISLVFSGFFILFGLIQLNQIKWVKGRFSFFKLQFYLLKKNKKLIDRFPLVLGLLTGLFPCSWLYSFLFFSSQLRGASEVLLTVFIFWLSSLPAFMVFTGLLQGLIKKSPFSYQKIAGSMLIAAGLFSVVGHWVELFSP
ncbi:MAG: sulfite exporter TauE/SafE family protein [Pseudobdellovibrio sp.]